MKCIWGMLILLLLAGMGVSSCAAEDLSVPELMGNWTGTSVGHYAESGYVGEGTFSYDLVVEEQKDRVFNGTLYESGVEGNKSYPFSGIIAHDMKTLYIAEHGSGQDIATLVSDTEMELILQVNSESGLAELCMLEKAG